MYVPVLVIGYERSGTTLLRRLISMHPDLNYELVHEQTNKLLQAQNVEHAYSTLTFPALQQKKPTGSTMSIKSGQKIVYVNTHGGKKAVKKFRELFPSSSVIHIVRKPLGCVNSQLVKFKRDPYNSIRTYFDSVPNMIKYLSTLTRVYMISYEELVSRTKQILQDLYEWLGNRVDEHILDKILSTRDPWMHEGRMMPGLRYFDGVVDQPREVILDKNIVNKVNSLDKIKVSSGPVK